MKPVRSISLLLTSFFVFFTLIDFADAAPSRRKRGGKRALKNAQFSLGLGVGSGNVEQKGLNNIINSSKTTIGSTTGEMSSALEIHAHGSIRFANGWLALQLRPSYMKQDTSGNSINGRYEFKLSGFTVFPMVRFIPLSNDYIDFYIQGGLGYGELKGEIQEGASYANYKGSAFGTQIGLGADFFLTPNHSFSVEGNYRYLPVDRNIVSSSAGVLTGISQSLPKSELEANGGDLGTTFTGVLGQITYTYHF